VVAQNRWSLNTGSLTGTGIVVTTNYVNDNWSIPS